jgi:CRP-like cAMP-binding protein
MNDSAAIESIIQASVPFAALPAPLVTRIAHIGHTVDYKGGDTIYDAGAPADALFLLLHGQVEHVFTPGLVGASDPLRLVGPGGLFGWSALLTNQPGKDLGRRLAKTVSRDDSQVLVIPARPLMDILASAPDAELAVVRSLLDMVRNVYGFAGFVKVHDHFVPAHLPSSATDAPKDYDTFAF